MKASYDRTANTEGFKEGQLVLLYNPQRTIGLSPKLQTHWEGPYSVIKRINDVVYRIQKYKKMNFTNPKITDYFKITKLENSRTLLLIKLLLVESPCYCI